LLVEVENFEYSVSTQPVRGKTMNGFMLGTKNYDSDWYLKYDLSYGEAARMLREWGFSFILTQSRFLPMADSAVISEVTPEQQARYATYDDLKFREALDREGIGYWPTLCTFFNPAALKQDPSLRPIDNAGRSMPLMDWYIGVTPSREDYVERQAEALSVVVEKLAPDGIFLSFIRWPGFWELWMPHHSRSDFPEYSYDRHSLERFGRETGIRLADLNPAAAATRIQSDARQAWTNWKCKVITGVIRTMREAAAAIKPDIQVMINTLPFGAKDYNNARDLTFGQNLESLANVVDIFEVMTYHQILKRPVHWIAEIGQEVKKRTGKKTVCTLQAAPLYLHGLHAAEKRSPSIETAEFTEAVLTVERAGLDGVVVFVWSDLLKRALVEKDRHPIDALTAAVANRTIKIQRTLR
jgi:hypothetical protein